MHTLTPKELKILELDDELMQWEAALNEAQETLDLITGPDYDPEKDSDDPDYHDQDIENFESEISEARKNIARITQKMHKLGKSAYF